MREMRFERWTTGLESRSDLDIEQASFYSFTFLMYTVREFPKKQKSRACM